MKYLKTLPLLFVACFLSGLLHAQTATEEEEKHPIDVALDACLDKDYSTAGMVECTMIAEKEWDKELNRAYGQLKEILTDDQQIKLRDAQRKWIEFRDAEKDFAGDFFYSQQGTIWRIITAGHFLEITKKRAEELAEYYNLITESY